MFQGRYRKILPPKMLIIIYLYTKVTVVTVIIYKGKKVVIRPKKWYLIV